MLCDADDLVGVDLVADADEELAARLRLLDGEGGGDARLVREQVAWMVTRSEHGEFVAAWLQGHGLSVGSEVLGRFSRVRRPAPSLQLPSDKPVVASCGATKTATLTMLGCRGHATRRRR